MQRTYLYLIAVTAIWGTQFALGKVIVASLPPLAVAFARVGLTAALYLLVLRLPDSLAIRREDRPLFLALALVMTPVYHAAFLFGLQLAPATDGALLLPTMNPVFAVLLVWLLGRETPSRQQLVGMGLSALGVLLVFVSVSMAGLVEAGPGRLLGDALYLLSSLCWATVSAAGRPLFLRYGTARATALTTLFGLPPVALLTILNGQMGSLASITPIDVGIIFVLGALGSFLGFLIFNDAVARIGAGAASRFTNLVPAWGLVVAALLLGERPLLGQLVGAAFIVFGVWVSTATFGRRRRRATVSG